MASNPPTSSTGNPAPAPTLAKGKPETVLRVLSLKDLEAASASLAESFADDHVSHYFLDGSLPASHPSNVALHAQIMTYITAAHMLRGLVTAAGPASDPYACVALWCPPGTHTDGLACLFRSGLWRLHYKLSREARTRMFSEFFPLLLSTKRAVLGAERDADSWYLVYIGTRPSGRGLGLARKTIEYVTRQADAAGKACYLESSNEVNPLIYGKLGFAQRRKIWLERDLGHGRIELDIMVREPVLAGTAQVAKTAVPARVPASSVRSVHDSLDGLSSVDSTETMEEELKNGIARLAAAAPNKSALPDKDPLVTAPVTLAHSPAVVA